MVKKQRVGEERRVRRKDQGKGVRNGEKVVMWERKSEKREVMPIFIIMYTHSTAWIHGTCIMNALSPPCPNAFASPCKYIRHLYIHMLCSWRSVHGTCIMNALSPPCPNAFASPCKYIRHLYIHMLCSWRSVLYK